MEVKDFINNKKDLMEKVSWVQYAIPAVTALGAKALGSVADKSTGSVGYGIQKKLFPVSTRVEAVDTAATSFLQSAGSNLGNKATDLLADMASKAWAAKDKAINSKVRKVIFNTLKKEDEIISQASDKNLLEAYHTMVNFAPSLSTDKNAVKSFLREAVQHEGGVNYNTIKMLASTEAELAKVKRLNSGKP